MDRDRWLSGRLPLAIAVCVVVASCAAPGNASSQPKLESVPPITTTTSTTTTLNPTARASSAKSAPRVPSATPTSKLPAMPRPLPAGVTLRQPDGSYPSGLPNDARYFPIGVWLADVQGRADITADRTAGLNTYVGMAHDPDVDMDAIESSGMHLLLQTDEWASDARRTNAAVDGWFVYDEADLVYGPGSDPWSGVDGWNTCVPAQEQGGQCGYTVMAKYATKVPKGALRYANYGVAITRWYSDAEASGFINGGFQNVVSVDDYGFTRPDADQNTRRGAFYGDVVQKVRKIDGLDNPAPARRQPVWAFVELGSPFSDGGTITADQMRSAVWHSIIAGARGLVYFNHNFGGPCPTNNVLREGCDPAMTPAVTKVDSQITELARVLNAPYADGFVTVAGRARAMAKLGPDGAWYVFAGADTSGGNVTFTVKAGTHVEVLYEDGRQLTVTKGQFVDTFADGNAVHIYRVT